MLRRNTTVAEQWCLQAMHARQIMRVVFSGEYGIVADNLFLVWNCASAFWGKKKALGYVVLELLFREPTRVWEMP